MHDVIDSAGPDVMGLAHLLVEVMQEPQWRLPIVPTVSALQNPPGMTVQIEASPSTVKAADVLVKSLRNIPFEVQGPFSNKLSAIPRIEDLLMQLLRSPA